MTLWLSKQELEETVGHPVTAYRRYEKTMKSLAELRIKVEGQRPGDGMPLVKRAGFEAPPQNRRRGPNWGAIRNAG